MNLKKLLPFTFIIFIVGILLLFVPYIFTKFSFSGVTFTQKDAHIGDAITGTTAPFIGVLGVIMTFLAFYIQFDANKQLRKDIVKDRFETKFYELLRLHKENVSEIDIGETYKARRAFVKMFEEFKFIYFVIESEKSPSSKLNELDQVKLAYHYFFFGTKNGQGVNEKTAVLPHHIELEKKVVKELQKQQLKYEESDQKGERFKLRGIKDKNSDELILNFPFKPFDGHVSKLAHYYRHLFQAIKFIVTNEELIWEEKYSYVKVIRGQLSNHEQAMIFYNACWLKQGTWWEDNNNIQKVSYRYILDYALIKNIPFNLTDQLGLDPVKVYKKHLGTGIQYINTTEVSLEKKIGWLFEWY